MASIGEGAARGIESGIRIGQSFIDQRQREEDRKAAQALQAQQAAQQQEDRAFQRERLGIQDARLAAQDRRQVLADERQQNIDAEQALGQEFADLQNEGKGLLEQYGDFGKVPKDLGDSYAMRVAGTRARLSEARAKRYAPLVEQERQKASQLWSRIQTGEVSLDQVPDADLVKSLTALTRRDVSDLMPIMGETNAAGLSPIQQAGRDFATGAETGNDEMMINAANMLFKPELMTGVGGPGRDGSEIVSKKIIKLIPHPNDPTHFTPLLEVKVRREDGKVGTYQAPVTENRSSDPNDNIKTLSIQDGLERVGQLTTLAEALNQRGILAKLANGINEAGDEPKNFLEAFYATGGQKPAPKKVDIGHFEDFGGYKVHYLPDGREVKIMKTAAPREHGGGGSGGETGAVLRNLDAARKGGIITEDEYLKRRRDLALGTDKPPKPDKPMPQTVVKQLQASRDNSIAINDLNDTFKDTYGGKGILGFGAEAQLQAGGVLGMDKAAVDWWKNYRKQAELVERHEMFGASLTPGEQASWRSADIHPGMDPKVIKKNLETRAGIARDIANNTRDDLIDAGYGEERILGIAGRKQPSRGGGGQQPTPAFGDREIDTSRPILNNDDGSFSTERTITVEFDDGVYNIPTIVGGKQRSEEEAVQLFKEGKNPAVGRFRTIKEAVKSAQERTNRIGQVRGVEASQMQPAQPKSRAEYDALPRGATYIDPQGQTRTKG